MSAAALPPALEPDGSTVLRLRASGTARRRLEAAGAWLLGIVWALPLLYSLWTAFHPAAFETHFTPSAPWTLGNFAQAWAAAPFARYFLNTFALISLIVAGQLAVSTLAAFAFARFDFRGRGIAFCAVLLQLMVLPEALMVENYRTVAALGLVDTLPDIALPYMASGFGIFLLRQAFLTVPRELDDAARVEGAGALRVLWHVYLPLARPTLVAYGLVSVSYHWNNLLWPLIVTDSVSTRPITVGLLVFASPDQGVSWSLVAAPSLMSAAPLLVGFLLFQRLFVQSFMRAGIK